MCGLGFTAFLAIWLGFLAVMIAAITMALVWAVRSRQFTNQDRARYLPLTSGIPADEQPKRQRGTHHDEL